MKKKLEKRNVPNGHTRKNNLRSNVLKGVTGVALTAGAIAVGAALSNKKNRDRVKRGARGVFKTASNLVERFSEEGAPVAQKVRRGASSFAHRLNIGRKLGMGRGRGRRSRTRR